jgi:hypothetical protein
MSQQKKLEQVLDLLLSEDSDRAAELLHSIIVEKARTIYESIVDEEDDVVGGEPSEDFTNDISADADDIDSDEQNDGEADDSEEGEEGDDEFGGEEGEGEEGEGEEGSVEDRIESLEDQLAQLTADFEEIMSGGEGDGDADDFGGEPDGDADDFGGDDEFGGEEDFGGEQDFGGEEDFGGEQDFGGEDGEEKVIGEITATMFEKQKAKKAVDDKAAKLKLAAQAKDKKKDKKVDEETKFLNAVGDTGQKGTAKLVGTGKGMSLGAEQNQSPYTHAPAKKDFGGGPVKIGKGTGGEYGKYHGDSATNKTPSDNVKVTPKNVSTKADTTAKFTGGKVAGDGFSKSPLSKKPA